VLSGVVAGDVRQAHSQMFVSRFERDRSTRVPGAPSGGEAPPAPRAAEVESLQMRDLAVRTVAYDGRLEKRARLALGEAREEAIHPRLPFGTRHQPAHALGFDQRRREKVVATVFPRLTVGVVRVPRGSAIS